MQQILMRASLPSHEEAEFSHAFCSLAGLGSAFGLGFAFAVAVFLVKFLFPALAFLL